MYPPHALVDRLALARSFSAWPCYLQAVSLRLFLLVAGLQLQPCARHVLDLLDRRQLRCNISALAGADSVVATAARQPASVCVSFFLSKNNRAQRELSSAAITVTEWSGYRLFSARQMTKPPRCRGSRINASARSITHSADLHPSVEVITSSLRMRTAGETAVPMVPAFRPWMQRNSRDTSRAERSCPGPTRHVARQVGSRCNFGRRPGSQTSDLRMISSSRPRRSRATDSMP